MARRADVVIIGAGLAGAATAYQLAQEGVSDILVLERERTPGMHASGRNAAMAFQILADGAEAHLAVEGTKFLATPPPGFCDHPLLRQCGSLLVASESGLAALREAANAASRLGLASRLIEAGEAGAWVPALRAAPVARALYTPTDGVVDIHALLHGFLTGARRAGARIRCGEAVRAIETANGKVARVRTDTSAVACGVVVNAAGAWATEVARAAGLRHISLLPRRRHLFWGHPPLPVERDAPFVWHSEVDVYFRPESGGILMSPCDATPHPAAEPTVDGAALDELYAKLERAFPKLLPSTIERSWACLRTFARDERFVIGRDPALEGFVWVAALGGHGVTTSAAVGRLAAAAVLGKPDESLRHFDPARLL